MPGPYAHITLLHEIMRTSRLKSIFSPQSEFYNSLMTYSPFCALGAVSPDYPNLAPVDGTEFRWADAMHYTRACEMITSGTIRVRESQGATRGKQLSWLLGYCAHVATDVTIHPIIQAKVGVYAQNQRQHRICEMNQDSYIYRRMNLGEIGELDTFAQTIAQCSSSDDRTRLDDDIVRLWEGMLADVHPERFVTNQPDSDVWHRHFIDKLGGNNVSPLRLFPLAGVISEKMGLTYPEYEKVDQQFIEEQLVPSEKPLHLHYDEIFDMAVGNVAAVWRSVEKAFYADTLSQPSAFGNWNLDNGCDEFGTLVFWDHGVRRF